MSGSNATPGIVAIIAGILLVTGIMTLVTGSLFDWLFVLAGIAVGLMAFRSIGR
jgi:hypothetical protein